MAIIAIGSITLTQIVDIASVTWYYKLQASTAAKPAKPTAATPSGWSTTEPTYTEGSTNSLYVCQKTTFSDGTFTYSDVSLSSSYEAAKLAYNKGAAALTAANSKNRHYYLASNETPSNPSNDDLWFKTDQGFALYRYDASTETWVKTGLGSAAFDTLDAGGASIGYLNSLLIKNKLSSNPVDYDYWNLSPYNVTDDGFTFEGNTLKTTHLIARNEIDVYGGSGSRIYIPADTGASVPDGTDDAYIDLQEAGLIIQSNTSDENEYLDATLRTIYPSDGTTTYRKLIYDGQGNGVDEIDYQSTHAVFVSTEDGDMGDTYVSRYVDSSEKVEGYIRRYNSSGAMTYDYGSIGTDSFSGLDVTENDRYLTTAALTSEYFEIERGELATYRYTHPDDGSPVGGCTDELQNFYHDVVRITPSSLLMSRSIEDPHDDLTYLKEQASFSLSTADRSVDFSSDDNWSFTINDNRIDVLGHRKQAYDGSAKTMSSAWGWINTVSVTVPENNTGVTLVWRVSVKGVFSAVAQWSTRGLRIARNGTEGSQELFTAAIAQLSAHCHEDFWEQAPGDAAITFTGRALCSVANATIQYNRIVAEVVGYY